ncbi:MAG: hypothetical protein MJZ95_05920 [Paludibacteraceae bacterium]|nr:hypothetical protein [Paludibacteraceae bacterium]
MKIPVPFPHIVNMSDAQLVPKIKDRKECETIEFFYGMAAPIFMKLFNGYFTDCQTPVEFINDFYADLMAERQSVGSRKIDGFAYECLFKNWIGKIALIFCFDRYSMKERRKEALSDYAKFNLNPEPELMQNIASLDLKDVSVLLSMMPNRQYSELIRMVYVDGMTLHDTAEALGVGMDRFFNMHRRAKLQYTQVYNKEFRK